ncbi:DNA replication factor C, large subunit [Ascodesmis nigricans]|uniref:Replication factor C subunit 1 n=1 Tax=Ascodesmis nigricans TaxID=341454 RepID=A0A4S2N4P9_9PEZI|nr:DNA replication factor C, large subunit [Ascodesmis nigricans]
MPADIRSFFAPKNAGNSSSQSKSAPAPTPAASARKAAAKKRRVVDSDDDDDEPPKKAAVKATAANVAKPKTSKKAPVEEKTTTSSYFVSSNKNKIIRSAPVKEPKAKVVKTPAKKPVHVIEDDGNDEADDIFAEAYGKADDDYKEEPEDDDMDDFVAPDNSEGEARPEKSKATPAKKTTAVTKKRKSLLSDDEDHEPPKKVAAKKAATSDKKPRRAPAKKAAESAPDHSFDYIPSIALPDVQKEEGKKFNPYAAQANRAAAETSIQARDPPVGAENCLAGLTFVFTGVLDGLSREDGQQLVKRYGGKVQTAPSSKTKFVVLGVDAGPKKIEVIKKHNLKAIDVDGLFKLIETLPANGGSSDAAKAHAEKIAKEEEAIRRQVKEMEEAEKKQEAERRAKAKADAARGLTQPTTSAASQTPRSTQTAPAFNAELWTVKYAPTQLRDICGNKGQVEKLQGWLHSWAKRREEKFTKRGADGMGGYRAVMIHGPPGIGKTTAAHLVARLEGYDVLEYNASDTRSKKLMEETMRGVLDNSSIMGFFAPDGKKVDTSKKKLVLVMDEVDGMSAGDRGGVGQLAALCKKTSIPIICICNERNQPKMKPFDAVCFNMPFRRPDANMIRSRIKTIAFKEKLDIPMQAVDALVEGTRADIRQIVNMLSTYKTTSASMSFDQSRDFAKQWEKHVVFKPWDISSKLLGYEMFGQNSKKTLNEKLELYFNDHEFSYLMIQENYLKVNPAGASGASHPKERLLKTLELAENAAASISDGDLADALIHGQQQHWSLMPTHGMLSTVIPAKYMHGSFAGYGPGGNSFTSWMGNNSKQGKLGRYVKEIQSHIRLRTSGDRHEVRQQYLPRLHSMLVRRLEKDGKDSLDDIIDTMDEYFLTKDDWDYIVELGVGPMAETTVNIPTASKTAFTRIYNQRSHPMPFIKASNVAATKAAKKEVPDIEDAIIESEDEGPPEPVVDEDEELDLSKDKYVKQAKPKKAAAKGKEKTAPGKATKGNTTAAKGKKK